MLKIEISVEYFETGYGTNVVQVYANGEWVGNLAASKWACGEPQCGCKEEIEKGAVVEWLKLVLAR